MHRNGPFDVTISIISHSNRDQILECLDCLERVHGADPQVEIAVLDNGSDDGSAEAIRQRFPSVRLIEQSYWAGFGSNHNAIIRATRSRYVLVLNDDTLVGPGAVEAMVRTMDADPTIGVLGPRLVYAGGRMQPSAWRYPTPAVCALWALTMGSVGIVQSNGEESRDVDWVSGSAMMIRRSALDDVGGFDETFYMYMEETDLCRRLTKAGYRVVLDPGVRVTHLQWGSTESQPERRTNELWRSRHYYWRKHHSAGGARVAAVCDGLRYSFGALCAEIVTRLPDGDRFFAGRSMPPSEFRLNARGAFFGPAGPGLRELASERNAARVAPPRPNGDN